MKPILPNMDLTSTSSNATITLNKELETSSTSSINNETHGSNTSYNSAIDNNQTTFVSFEDSGNNNDSISSVIGNKSFTLLNSSIPSSMNINNGICTKINGSDCEMSSNAGFSTPTNMYSQNLNCNMRLIEAERLESLIGLQEEVDPKSQLANKTIFKTNNPNLSIIEINENSIKEQDMQNSIVVIESPSDEDDVYIDKEQQQQQQQQRQQQLHNSAIDSDASIVVINNVVQVDTTKTINSNTVQYKILQPSALSEKRRSRTESLLHSKQNLNIVNATEKVEAVEPAIEDEVTASNNTEQSPSKRPLKVYDTLEEFEKNLPSTVTVLETPFGSRVYLVGTAHFSEESQDDVSFVIRNVRPDVVMVELCPSRIPILKLDEKTLLEEAKNINLSKIRNVIHTHGYVNGIFFILLLQMSVQMAKDVGMAPGGEFRRAFEEIHKLPNCKLHLGDRPIRITLHRALRALSFWQTIKLVWHLTANKSITIEEIEECKQRDLLEKLMQELAGEFPAFSQVFVKERDLFLCHSLQLAALPQTFVNAGGVPRRRPVKVVGVVGIGHANGIAQMWGQVDPQKIPEILEIPPASLSARVCKYTLKYSLLALTVYGAFRLFRPRWIRL